jgi:hypothetical protein
MRSYGQYGPIEQGEKVLRPLREFNAPALDAVGVKPYPGCHHSATPQLR